MNKDEVTEWLRLLAMRTDDDIEQRVFTEAARILEEMQ